MKIVVLGGAGAIARRTVKELAGEQGVSEILVADYNEVRAQTLVREISLSAGGSRKTITSSKVNANDSEGLKKAVSGFDIVASGCGPFYKYELPVAQAVLEAGANYVSLCDDYDAAEKIFDLDPLAKRKGLTVLTGMGWAPGYSNVLARYGADMLDEVEEINTSWGCSAFDTDGVAVILHLFHVLTGWVPTFRDGRKVLVKAGKDRTRVRFPSPVGDITVSHLGHPEPVTMPRFMKGVKTVTTRGGLAEGYMNSLTKLVTSLPLTKMNIKGIRAIKIAHVLSSMASRLMEPSKICSAVRVDIRGKRKKNDITLSYGAAAHMDALAGIPMAIGALMMGRGEISEKGVLAPEACVDPMTFLREAEKRGITTFTGESMDEKLILH